MTNIPTDAAKRKALPVATGVIDYFPDALAAVAEVSRVGNEQPNPGKPLFWDRSKSGDESDALMRHFLERGTIDSDGLRHSGKVAWRALALLQKEIENEEKQKAEQAEEYAYKPGGFIRVRSQECLKRYSLCNEGLCEGCEDGTDCEGDPRS